MARRGRKPNVATDVITQRIFESESGALTTADLSCTAARLNGLVTEGVLALRKGVQPILDDNGKVQRGRPRKLYGLSKSTRSRLRRQAAKAA